LANTKAVFSWPCQSVYWIRRLCTLAGVPLIVLESTNQFPWRKVVVVSPEAASRHVIVGSVVEVFEPLGVTTHWVSVLY
jgi:hypothetical protein